MSLNENLKTRRTQLAVLATVIAVGAATAGGVMWYGNHQEQQKHPAPVAAPNMTGVVTASFNEQVNDAALAQQQAKIWAGLKLTSGERERERPGKVTDRRPGRFITFTGTNTR